MTISTWRKKPVEIQAAQWTGDNTSEIIDWMLAAGEHSARYHEATETCDGTEPEHIAIDTLEGTIRASIGDFIIRRVQGEFYPCKPGIFDATYEPAEPAPRAVPARFIEPNNGYVVPQMPPESREKLRQAASWYGGRNVFGPSGDDPA